MSRSILRSVAVPLAAVILGLLIGALLIVSQGASPIAAYSSLLKGGLGDGDALLRTLQKATPLIFGGLAVAFAFKAGYSISEVKANYWWAQCSPPLLGSASTDCLPSFICLPHS